MSIHRLKSHIFADTRCESIKHEVLTLGFAVVPPLANFGCVCVGMRMCLCAYVCLCVC